MSGEQEHHICLYRFSFHKPIKSRLARGRLYLPGQRYELHHRICNLRYEPLVDFEFCRLQHGLTDFHSLDVACRTVWDK